MRVVFLLHLSYSYVHPTNASDCWINALDESSVDPNVECKSVANAGKNVDTLAMVINRKLDSFLY